MFRRVLLAALAAVSGLVLAATPAWAHEEINPNTFPTGQPTFFTLSAANEKKADLVKLVLNAPAGVPIGATTKEPAGWTVTRSDTAITWIAGSATGLKPDHFEQWDFETDGADQPGTFPFKLTLAYADGSNDSMDVPVTVVAGSGVVTSTGATGSGAVGHQSQGRANKALAVGIAGIILGLVALAFAMRRRPKSASGADGAAQDW